MKLTLPWPPSVNHYYRHVGHKTLISKAGRDFSLRVMSIVMATGGLRRQTGLLAIRLEAWRPDGRRRDLDNLWKPMLDSLQRAGLVDNDDQFRHQAITDMGVDRPDGRIVVLIDPFGVDPSVWCR